MRSGELHNVAVCEDLERRYYFKKKGVAVVLEELKQRILAKTGKIKRYQRRIEQCRQNKMFQSNQKSLLEMLENEEKNNSVVPDTEESMRFSSSIWDNPVSHNTSVEWLNDVENKFVGIQKQNDITITLAQVTKQLKKMGNWKAPGRDGLQGNWLKNLTSSREGIAAQLRDCRTTNQTPEWFTKGRTVLVLKDKEKGNIGAIFVGSTTL